MLGLIDARIDELLILIGEELDLVRVCAEEGDRFSAARHCGKASDMLSELERLQLA